MSDDEAGLLDFSMQQIHPDKDSEEIVGLYSFHAHLAPQQPSAVVLRRAPLGRRLGLLLIVAGVVVLDDVILPAE